MADKYLKGGAINPVWQDEEDMRNGNYCTCSPELELFKIGLQGLKLFLPRLIEMRRENSISPYDKTMQELEAKYDFMNKHNDTQEAKIMCKLIVENS